MERLTNSVGYFSMGNWKYLAGPSFKACKQEYSLHIIISNDDSSYRRCYRSWLLGRYTSWLSSRYSCGSLCDNIIYIRENS
jgi:hypothetical protein